MSSITLYHRTYSSDSWRGVEFEDSKDNLERLENDGWVDSNEKMNETYPDYLMGRVQGIDKLHPDTQPRCPIWDSIACCRSVGAGFIFNSPRTDGAYLITAEARDMLANQDSFGESFRVCLTAWMIERRRLGQSIPTVDRDIIQQIQDTHRLERIQHRSDRLLQFISSLSQELGKPATIGCPATMMRALAWSHSTNPRHVTHLRNHLVELGCLRFTHNNDFSDTDLVNQVGREFLVTVDGWKRLEELERAAPGESSQAFVAMWLNSELDDAWNNGIRKGIEDAGYTHLRIDEKKHNDKICDQIIVEIRRSRFVVADFTHGPDGARGGVYFEAGFAGGLGLDVIYTCRKGQEGKIHFDTRQYNHVLWRDSEDLRKQLSERILATIGQGPIKHGE